MTSDPLLLISDQQAGHVRLVRVPSGEVVQTLENRHLCEHAGFLALPGGRRACVDDRAGELLVLDPWGAAAPGSGRPLVEARYPVAIPAEHLAADPSGRKLAVTTGLGANDEPWCELLTVVDLTSGDCARVRTRPGEPGVTVLGGDDPLVVLRHREPGQLAGYPYSTLLTAEPGCPTLSPHSTLPLPHDGHGDAQDPATARVFAATGDGVHRARRHAEGQLVSEPPLPWESPARGYFLQLDTAGRRLWSCLRGGPSDPTRWSEWTNEAWSHQLDDARTTLTNLGTGLVFRMALSRQHAAFARVHPDGDELILLDLGEAPVGAEQAHADRVRARIPLPPMDDAPRAGTSPWEGVQRRSLAASPGSDWVAVSRGGHGEIQLIDCAGQYGPSTLRLDTPLDHGGRLAMLCQDDGAEGDPVGR